jgi:mannosyltransferase OCH1-like enzyme
MTVSEKAMINAENIRFCPPLLLNNHKYTDVYQIPKIIHQIWIGDLKNAYCHWMDSFRVDFIKEYPHWEYKLWNYEKYFDLYGPLMNQKIYDLEDHPSIKADILRYEILYREGGLYVDADSIWIPGRSIDDILNLAKDTGLVVGPDITKSRTDFKYGYLVYANGVIGASFNHPGLLATINLISKEFHELKIVQRHPVWICTGPYIFSFAIQSQNIPFTAVDADIFYPGGWMYNNGNLTLLFQKIIDSNTKQQSNIRENDICFISKITLSLFASIHF